MRANDKLIHLNDLNQVTVMRSSEANEMITRELVEECAKRIEELSSMTWTVDSASTNAYSTSSGLLYKPSGIVTYRDLENSYSDYCKEEKEKEQKERVDNIMNKYGLI